MRSFDSNDYRRRVLAVVHSRGGAEHSDPFEIYDIPLDEVDTLDDAAIEARTADVGAFWQRSRDHPRYRGVIIGLLGLHAELVAALATRTARLELRDRVAAARAARDDERFASLDAAVGRLVARFGGLPEDKIVGLRALAASQGIDDPAFTLRIRRHRALPAGSRSSATEASAGAIPAEVLGQVRADLDELGRITGSTPPRSLFDLIGVRPGTGRAEIRAVRDAALVRNRARRPDRRRALLDDLLAAVGALLVDGEPDAYLDALAVTTTERLRPRVAAAVLVEDVLLPVEAAALVAEAEADGLDAARARGVVTALAREHRVLPSPSPWASPPTTSGRPEAAPDRPSAPRTAADELSAASDLRLEHDRLRWTWPAGCTEMMLAWRVDAPPVGAPDSQAQVRKVTNTRYEIDGGVPLPATRPLYVALFGCLRESGRLVVATLAAPGARIRLDPDGPVASASGGASR